MRGPYFTPQLAHQLGTRIPGSYNPNSARNFSTYNVRPKFVPVHFDALLGNRKAEHLKMKPEIAIEEGLAVGYRIGTGSIIVGYE